MFRTKPHTSKIEIKIDETYPFNFNYKIVIFFFGKGKGLTACYRIRD
ncbi:hypothetical protein [Psychroserpens luteus]|uniref:Uncharacterized protein n=1 Tax=Psychroserpens luteus TaxID=1434066 RepID=A0ABW5ZMQ6_9FLAO|nr:hypothetical protein [Psychroserpens luteus]